jgi:hypothetical protein
MLATLVLLFSLELISDHNCKALPSGMAVRTIYKPAINSLKSQDGFLQKFARLSYPKSAFHPYASALDGFISNNMQDFLSLYKIK